LEPKTIALIIGAFVLSHRFFSFFWPLPASPSSRHPSLPALDIPKSFLVLERQCSKGQVQMQSQSQRGSGQSSRQDSKPLLLQAAFELRDSSVIWEEPSEQPKLGLR
jgi:hypothetical protein